MFVIVLFWSFVKNLLCISNPSAGTKAYAPANSATIGPPYAGGAYTAPVTAINFQLMLAVETNQDLRTMIMNQVATSGLSYLIPYVQAFKINNSGTSQNISVQLDQGNGRSLMKVYTIVLKILIQCTITQIHQ